MLATLWDERMCSLFVRPPLFGQWLLLSEHFGIGNRLQGIVFHLRSQPCGLNCPGLSVVGYLWVLGSVSSLWNVIAIDFPMTRLRNGWRVWATVRAAAARGGRSITVLHGQFSPISNAGAARHDVRTPVGSSRPRTWSPLARSRLCSLFLLIAVASCPWRFVLDAEALHWFLVTRPTSWFIQVIFSMDDVHSTASSTRSDDKVSSASFHTNNHTVPFWTLSRRSKMTNVLFPTWIKNCCSWLYNRPHNIGLGLFNYRMGTEFLKF